MAEDIVNGSFLDIIDDVHVTGMTLTRPAASAPMKANRTKLTC
jgi:hypothetical protein